MSSDRVVLPDGPGSIDGIGDNVSVDGNMGAMTNFVPIEVPEGHPGMTPDLTLRYSSMGGTSVVGAGWSLMVPSIERLTLRGLPEYDRDDEMAANGSSQLVRVASTANTATYRARHEREFIRYTWHDTNGRAGYWTAEFPDGRVGYFGADADGNVVADARLERDGNTFRWMLVEVVDPFDHRLRYEYDATSGTPLLSMVHWVHDASGNPRYRVELEYASRPDPISDASPGFEEFVRERVSAFRVRARGEVIRTYRLGYEDQGTSGGVSRLVLVERFGRAGGRYPVVSRFTYSRSITGVCGAALCDRPFVVDMGSVPGAGGLGRGDATLIDINGDALPDLLDTSLERHRFYLNELDGDGQGHFDAEAVESAIGTRTPFALGQAAVQVLDVNGDGFADLIDAFGGGFLCNLGRGDWVSPSDPAFDARCGATGPTGVPMELDTVGGAGDPDPLRTRFVDLDGDRRVDILRTDTTSATRVWLNRPDGFTERSGIEPLGVQFDGETVQLADMNGDGLLDVVRFEATGAIRYRLNYGHGRFSRVSPSQAFSVADAPALGSTGTIALLELEDLNGDGLDDLVLVEGSTVSFAVNRNAGRFDPFRVIDTAMVPDLPTRTATTTVLFADMNGNGSRDAVWVEQTGRVRYLELFPVRPNLLARVENGIGMVHTVTYGRSVAHRAQSETPWLYPLTSAMTVVDRTDTFVTLTGSESGGLHDIVEYSYRDGFYDGVEKIFRGYGRVEQRSPANVATDGQEPAHIVEAYDLGVDDPYRAGLLLNRQVFSGAEERALREERHTYEDAELEGVGTGTVFPVRHLCETETLTIHKEGAAPEAWATTRVETQYDGYGNPTLTVEHGVVHMGPPEAARACGACASNEPDRFAGACGDACLGDERYTERALIEPGSATSDRWILGAVHRERSFGAPGGPASEVRTFYDGPDFTGLADGRLERGRATRRTQRVSDDESIELGRAALDAHGNVVVQLDPLGSSGEGGAHRRAYTYDGDGLQVVRVEIFTTSPEGEPYRLRQEYGYEPALDEVIESTTWMVDGAGASSARNPTYYAFDEHARLIALTKPGDTVEAPSIEVSYELGDPASRIVLRQRSTAGAAPNVITARCLDGRGRLFQELNKVREGEWLASGFLALNRAGAMIEAYQPYTVSSGACATAAPQGVRHAEFTYDGIGRRLTHRLPDGELSGGASETRFEFLPLAERYFDEEDLDGESPNAGTPELARMDGLGRPIALERLLRTGTGLETAVTSVFYDGRGNVAGFVDPAGHEKRQTFDLASRLLRIDDASSGTTVFEHDAAGNVVARTDARGVTTRTDYDGANRPVARYDTADPQSTQIDIRWDFARDCEDCTNAENRVVETTYPLAAAIADRLGGPRGADRFGFDARGRLRRRERVLGALPRFVQEDILDGADRRTTTRFPDGQTVERRYDDAGRLIAIDGLVDRIEYDERGQRARMVRADGSDEVTDHDALLRPSRTAYVTGGGEVIQENNYARDRRGQIVEVVAGAAVPGALETGTTRFAYDSFHRLLRAHVAIGLGNEETLSFEHDLTDNLLSATSSLGAVSAGHVGAFAYDGDRASLATQIGQLTQSYDAGGFLVERDGMELTWDHLGRLVEARRDGEVEGVFAYCADQERVAKLEDSALTLYVSPDFEIRDGLSRAYARVGTVRVARTQSTALSSAIHGDPDGDGAATAADALFADRAVQREGLVHASARRLLHEAAPEPVQFFHDHLGSLVAATRKGEVTGRAAYHPYGETRAQTGFIDEHGFTGQERDASTGLLAFEFRYLDTYGGRWASADPAFEAIGDLRAHSPEHYARHGYVRGDPTNRIDPNGLVATPPEANDSYDKIMRWVQHDASFATPRGGAVFYSYPNRTAARQWATTQNQANAAQNNNGGDLYKTIEMTAGGGRLDGFNLSNRTTLQQTDANYLTRDQVAAIWDMASSRFAESASGGVQHFGQGSTDKDPTSTSIPQKRNTFPRIELPRLRQNRNVTHISHRDNAGNVTRTERTPPQGTAYPPAGHGTGGR